MHFSKIFILRPVATTLLMVALFLSGLMAFNMLPVSALPSVDYPIIRVLTLYPGASSSVMDTAITVPLEGQLSRIPGLKNINSSSSAGASVITLRFDLDTDLGVAEQEVQATINTVRSLLPSDLPSPPIYNKVNLADLPALTIAVTSESMPLQQISDLVDTRITQKIAQISGVGMVSIAGGQRPAIRIVVNGEALAAYGLSFASIRSLISSANVNQPKGNFDGPTRIYQLDTNDQLKTIEEYGNLILKYENNTAIRLQDVATIIHGVENNKLAAWANKNSAILINIQKQPGANVIDVVDHIQKILPDLKNTLPSNVDLNTLTDRTTSIRDSILDVEHELILSILLVVIITFIFLRTFSATIIPSITVPLSLIATFIVMYFLGFTINNLTLMALTIATGFVVDDAIVMLENIARHLEKGLSPIEAAIKGSGEISFTLISLTFSLIAVLIPLLFMGDIIGRLFREFAITLAVAIFISLIISLTLTPMMCAKFLRNHHEPENSLISSILNWLNDVYARALRWVLAHQKFVMLTFLATLILQVCLYIFIPKGFFPKGDIGIIQGITFASQSASFASISNATQHLVDEILKDEAVASVTSFIGIDGDNVSLNSGRMTINLKQFSRRKIDSDAVIARMKPKLQGISDMQIYLQPIQDLSIAERITPAEYQFIMRSPDNEELSIWSEKIFAALQNNQYITDISSDLQNKGQQIHLNIDRDAATRSGISVSQINDALYDAFGQRQISTIYTQSNQYRVVIEAKYNTNNPVAALNSIYISGVGGKSVQLSALVSYEFRPVAVTIYRVNQFPVVTFSFNLRNNVALSQATESIEQLVTNMQMPNSIYHEFTGSASAFKTSLTSTLWLILAAVITMYIVLGVLYESYIHPLTILSTLPSAGVGALTALFIVGGNLDLIAIIGIILLIGIVKKNAIMMIDFALEEQRNKHISPTDAIYAAALLRFRPILMTTLVALFAAIPILFATGTSAGIRRPLGITMIGGLTLSQFLTLFTTPVIYLYFDRFIKYMKTINK